MITTTAEVTFLGHPCNIVLAKYREPDNIALLLFIAADGHRMATASFNPDIALPKNYVAIKNWAENAGMTRALLEAGVIGSAEYEIPTGFVVGTVHKVLLPEIDQLQ